MRILKAFILTFFLSCLPTLAQKDNSPKRQSLPSPDKIVGNYLKAIGGKKRVASIKDATYEWKVEDTGSTTMPTGTATTLIKAPASARTELNLQADSRPVEAATTTSADVLAPRLITAGANGRSAWVRNGSDSLKTLTDAQAHAAKLQSILDATHLLEFKKSNVLARTAGIDSWEGEPAYIVEFSLRTGARLRYWFSVKSKLLIGSENKSQNTKRAYSSYEQINGVVEPHKVAITSEETGNFTLTLQQVRYNTGLADSIFDPPAAESIDVSALLYELDRNQERIDERVSEYTYTEKYTERKINDRGEVTGETTKVYEVYPLPDRGDVRKLISENGVALSADKAAKEDKRVLEEMEKAERERAKAADKREKEKQKGQSKESDDDDVGIADFLRAAELVSPRRERLRDRNAIVVDFRPRVGYKPKNSAESIVSKLAGIVWIDPLDKMVMRLEARLVESYKVGGGLLASVRPGTALIFEQKRMDDGVWLPVFTQANISAKVLLFKGINFNVVQEFSNYQRFKSNIEDYKLTGADEKDKPSKP